MAKEATKASKADKVLRRSYLNPKSLTFLAYLALLAFLANVQASPSKTAEGWKAYRESRLSEAERYWKEAAESDPYDRDARAGLRKLREERLTLPTSEPYAQAVKDLYEAGMKAYRKEHWDEAEEALARAEALLPGHPLIQGRLEEVRGKAGKKVAVDPPAELVTTLTMEAAPAAPVQKGTPASKPPAKKPSRPAPIRMDPAQVESLYAEGMKAYRQKKFREALETWRKVVALDPNHAKARNNIKRLEGTVEPLKGE